MSCVSCVGFVPASSGTAILYGHDLRTDIDAVRATVAVCPQEPVLYRFLTVEEHLTFLGTVSISNDVVLGSALLCLIVTLIIKRA